MNRSIKSILIIASAVTVILHPSLQAQQCNSGKKRSSVWAGFGTINVDATQKEFFTTNGENLAASRKWSADNALTFNVGFKTEGFSRLSLFGDAVVSLGGAHSNLVGDHFVDPVSGAFSPTWLYRETADDTNLDHYVQLDAGFDYKAISTHCYDMDFRFGFRYTDLAFSSNGGVLSLNGFPDTFPLDPSYSQDYHQKIPAFYVNPRFNFGLGEKTQVSLGALAGLTFAAKATDFQPDRGGTVVATGEYATAPHGEADLESAFIWGLNGKIEHDISDRVGIYLSASYDQTGEGQGEKDASGADNFNILNVEESAKLRTMQVNFGIKVTNTYKPLFGASNLNTEDIFKTPGF